MASVASPATLAELVVLHASGERPPVRELLERAIVDVARVELNGVAPASPQAVGAGEHGGQSPREATEAAGVMPDPPE